MTIYSNNDASFFDFPFRIGGDGGVGRTDGEDHVRDMIEQVLFTNPGERINLPEFGCGLRKLVFAGNNEILRATVQFIISQNLNRWLGETINVEQVNVSSEEETLAIEIVYSLKRTLERRRVSLNLQAK
jgi:hypothetical protein